MISVCIATHNAEKYIVTQLNSILCQLSNNDEVIVSDDGSIDNTINLIKSIKDSRIQIYNYVHTEDYSNKQLSSYYYATANFYNALLKAKGDVIFLSDQDDIWARDKVAVSLRYLEHNDIVCSNFAIINSNDEIINPIYWDKPLFENLSFYKMWKYLPFRGCCLSFKREVLLNAFPFPKGLFLHDCWIGLNAILGNYRYKFINEPLLMYRRHNNNVSLLDSPNSFYFKIEYRVKLLWQIFKIKCLKKLK